MKKRFSKISDHIAGSRSIFCKGDMKMKIKKVEHNPTFYCSFIYLFPGSRFNRDTPFRMFIYLTVPGTGFEPAQPFGCCHLKTVRLPISPPGQGCKYNESLNLKLETTNHKLFIHS